MAIARRVLGRIQASVALPGRARNRLLRAMGVAVGDRVFVNHGVTILGSALTLEDDAFVNTAFRSTRPRPFGSDETCMSHPKRSW